MKRRPTLSKIKRDELRYEQMLYRCESHNAQAETTTRMATPEETEKYIKLIEQDKKERELASIEKARFYECEARRNS